MKHPPPAREKVYLVADSLDWVLAYHERTHARTVSCNLFTRVQPGAEFVRFWEGFMTFTVYLMQAPAGTTLSSFRISVDGKPPFVRQPTDLERTKNVLHLRGSEHKFLVGAKQLHVRALYTGEGSHQDLAFDLTGFDALYGRAIQFDCRPPRPH